MSAAGTIYAIAAIRLASSPTKAVSVPLIISLSASFTIHTSIPSIGPIMKVASIAGKSAKSNFIKAGAIGIGKSTIIRAMLIAPNIATRIIFFVVNILCFFVFRFITFSSLSI